MRLTFFRPLKTIENLKYLQKQGGAFSNKNNVAYIALERV